MLHKGLLIILLCLLPTGLVAAHQPAPAPAPQTAQEAQLATWHWPDLGLTFQYPESWYAVEDERFDFVLIANDEDDTQYGFIGVQSIHAEDDQTMQNFFDNNSDSFEEEATEITFGDVDALTATLPENNAQRGRVIGFRPTEEQFGLMVISGRVETWDTFSEQIDSLVESVEITPLELDLEALNSQFETSLDEQGTLIIGSPEASVHMVEVLDFSCPHCVDYSSRIKRVINDYVQPGDIQLEFRIVTFVGGELSETAAHAQYCAAAQGIGWDMHKGIMDLYQTSNGANAYTTEQMNTLAESLGADSDAFSTCLEEKTYAPILEETTQLLDEWDVTGTPSLLFAEGDAELAFIQTGDGEPARGGLPLLPVYNHLDSLLGDANGDA